MDDLSAAFGTIASVMFAVSHVPMVVKAVRTRDVRSYSIPNLVLVNAGNALWTVYVLSLPIGPIWALHSLYVIAGATMLGLVIRERRVTGSRSRSGRPRARRPGPLPL